MRFYLGINSERLSEEDTNPVVNVRANKKLRNSNKKLRNSTKSCGILQKVAVYSSAENIPFLETALTLLGISFKPWIK